MARKEQKALQKTQAKEKELARDKAVSKFYDKKTGWKLESLPYDMSPVKETRKQPVTLLDVAGMKGIAKASVVEDGVLFSMKLKDTKAVEAAEKCIADNHLKATLVRGDDGSIVAVSKDPAAISTLAKGVYPAKEITYSREIVHSRQYVIEGCSTY